VRSASRAFGLRLQLALHLDQAQTEQANEPAALSAFFCIGLAETEGKY